MSAVSRDRVYRISGWGTTSDWVVLRRERDGNVRLSSASLQTTIIAHESKLIETVVADRDAKLSPPSLFLGPQGDARLCSPAAAGLGIGSPFDPAASSVRAASSPDVRHGQPLARTSDPDTSRAAAIVARNKLTDNQRRVLIAHAEAGADGLSGDEMAEKMGGEAQYALLGPRRPQLERAGFLEKAGLRPNRRNNPVQVYRCTPSGFALAAQWMEADRARAI